MSLQQWVNSQANPEVVVNENFDILAALAVYGRDPTTTSGLTWGYIGGRWGGFSVTAGTLTLTASSTNYIVVERTTGVISTSVTDTNWVDTGNYARLYQAVTGVSTVTSFSDFRIGEFGILPSGTVATPGTDPVPAPLTTEAGSSRDMLPTDANAYVRFTATGAKTCTFDNANGFAAPEEYHIANRSASDNLTLSGTGITLNPPKGGTLVLEPGDTVTVKFVSATVADVFGSTVAA